jgi:MFS family permease
VSGPSLFAELRSVLAERDFRRLLSVRLISQAGDGIVTAGVGTYVFFNASTFPSPSAAAAAFTVLYLPYSVIGPFAGVLIDRWSRRQILVISALLRSAFVVVTAAVMASGNRGVPLYVAVLLVLGVNRFFLASLSAALPHVVAEDKLVMANSVSPTAGGIVGAIGGITALGLNAATGDTERGAAMTLLAAGCCYVAAGAVAATMRRDLLGPQFEPGTAPGPILGEVGAVVADLAAAARYTVRHRGPASVLGATGAGKFLFGILTVLSILLYRNYFYPSSAPVAEGHVVLLATVSALGYGCAALVVPPATRRISKRAVIALMLAAAGVVTGTLGETFDQVAYLAFGFLLYLTAQSVAICSVTVIQEQADDAYRGRLFAFYDVMFNVSLAAGALLSAAFMPLNGRSSAIIEVVAAGYAIAAAGFWVLSRQPAPAAGPDGSGGSEGAGGSGTSRPSASAQRSNS